MRKALRILLWLAVAFALLLGVAVYLLYAPHPAEPALGGGAIERHSLRVGDRDRSYLLYAPARPSAAPALVILFHGSMGTAAGIRAETGYGFERIAEREGFLVAYPQGYEGNWNDCRKLADYPARR